MSPWRVEITCFIGRSVELSSPKLSLVQVPAKFHETHRRNFVQNNANFLKKDVQHRPLLIVLGGRKSQMYAGSELEFIFFIVGD
ncbi:MAG: hypothetical protein JOZ78_20040 [Chroococcidiopsidaceae cyanobacterium CP_BM_ER_R8_30]|nr:hypothetical protein [Chroococcidiopsidaceae cyanobacterium CP_BM_ER_R8_30]